VHLFCICSLAKFAVCLVGPVGPAELWAAASKEFIEFCVVQDWEPVFYFARAELLPVLSECGLKGFKVGEDARLGVADFSLKGGKFENLRTACNKARKEGKHLLWYQPGEGRIDYGLEAQLRKAL
jgi:phosphatidylglycerol lysyltransferase